MQARFYLMGAVLILTALSAPGQAQPTESATTNKRQAEKGEEIPSLEFLEFLGEWETEDGRWIDPEELEQMPVPDSKKKNEDEDEKI
jgi:hypothetical protein